MGEGLLYSNSSRELIYYGECLLYDTGFVTRVTRWVPLVEHTHVHMHTHMFKSCLFYAGGNQKWLSRLAHPSMISIQCS